MLTLAGWVLDREMLKAVLPGLVPMNPVTALGFLMAVGATLVLCNCEAGPGWRSRQIAHVLAMGVMLVGLQRIVAYAAHWPWALDELLFRSRLNDNRMAPNTAWCFVALGLA